MKSIYSSEYSRLMIAFILFLLIAQMKSDTTANENETREAASDGNIEAKETSFKLKFNETCSLISSCSECGYTDLLEKSECLKTGQVEIYKCNLMNVHQECIQTWRPSTFILFTILSWTILGFIFRQFVKFRKRLESKMMSKLIGEEKNSKSS